MNNRETAIDFLRGLAIVGMIVCGQMLWNAQLPAAMFHAQLPPPTFAFNPDVPGITWVDLVFPFFLFSMGAALPFALRRKEEKGCNGWSVFGGACHRWVWLTFFAILLGNTRMALLGNLPAWGASLLTLGVWGAFFVLFARVNPERFKWAGKLNGMGFILCVLVLLFYNYVLGVEVSTAKADIIILILSNMALFATMIWWLTRNNLTARVCIIGVAALLKLSADVEGSWCHQIWSLTPYPGVFQFSFLMYLCIILPGSIVGDMIYAERRARKEAEECTASHKAGLDAALLGVWAALFGVQLWGLFVREIGLTVLFSALLSLVGMGLVKRMKGGHAALVGKMFSLSVLLLMVGLVAEPMEGGIKKDPATLSYFFVTSAMAIHVLLMVLVAEKRFGFHLRSFEYCGANPMMAYTASGYVIVPLLTLTGLAPWLHRFVSLTPWMGVLRGVLFAVFVLLITGLFTRKRIFWKS